MPTTEPASVAPTQPIGAAPAKVAFGPTAKLLAEQIAPGLVEFAPGKPVTTLAEWFADTGAGLLVLVVGPHTAPDVADEVLAYALAWQHDRDLVLVLPESHIGLTLDRLAWIATPVRVFTYGADLVVTPAIVPSRAEVTAAVATLPLWSQEVHKLGEDRAAWVESLIKGADEHWALVAAHRHSYLAWHCAGRQVLRIARSRQGIDVVAGVDYSKPPVGDEKPVTFNAKGPLTPPERARIEARVALAVRDRLTGHDHGHAEHRLQAALAATGLRTLGLRAFAREYPAWRGAGRPGFIDFLGVDHENLLHVVETKVGTADVKGVLQTLDYATWVYAHSTEIRQERSWGIGPANERIILDFVLSPSKGGKAIGPYLAGQLEALAGDVAWRVAIVADPLAEIPDLSRPLWRALPRHGPLVSAPVQPARWAARTAAALRTNLP